MRNTLDHVMALRASGSEAAWLKRLAEANGITVSKVLRQIVIEAMTAAEGVQDDQPHK